MRRCFAPKCRNSRTQLDTYCFQHWGALDEKLQARLMAAKGTVDWVPALAACQDHLIQAHEWVKNNVTGGSSAHFNKTRG